MDDTREKEYTERIFLRKFLNVKLYFRFLGSARVEFSNLSSRSFILKPYQIFVRYI